MKHCVPLPHSLARGVQEEAAHNAGIRASVTAWGTDLQLSVVSMAHTTGAQARRSPCLAVIAGVAVGVAKEVPWLVSGRAHECQPLVLGGLRQQVPRAAPGAEAGAGVAPLAPAVAACTGGGTAQTDYQM